MGKVDNPRRRRQQWERRDLLFVLLLLFVAGEGIIAIVYGSKAALSALLCLLPGAALITSLWLLLTIVERWLDRD